MAQAMIERLVAMGMDRQEAECIAYANSLKMKLHELGRTSHEWSARGSLRLSKELSGVDKMKPEEA